MDEAITEDYQAMKIIRRDTGVQRLSEACSNFKHAALLANEHGMELSKKSRYHYQLRNRGPKLTMLVNLYPSNQRIYRDKKYPGAFLKVPTPWRLVDVVNAEINATSNTGRQPGKVL